MKQPLFAVVSRPPTLFRSEANLRASVLLNIAAAVLALWSAWRMLACDPDRREWVGLASAVALFAVAVTFFS